MKNCFLFGKFFESLNIDLKKHPEKLTEIKEKYKKFLEKYYKNKDQKNRNKV